MGQDPEVIRREIQETRERMGDTVDALAYKADVKTRAKESVSEKVDTLKSKVTGAKDSVSDTVSGAKDSVSDATPSTGDVKHHAKRTVGIAQENPLGLAIGAAAAGFLIGMALPSTSIEDEKLGEQADAVKRAAGDVGREALERGKTVAQEATKAGLDAARSAGQQQADELTSSAKERTDELTSG